jgi:DNA-directed RNA polymerase specialized sigma24 family protein
LHTTRDAELERWCRSQWQVHAVRRRRPDYREQWPTREAFQEHWPLLAQHLIQAAEQIRNEAAGHHDLLPVPYELLDPPKAEPRDWRKLYAAELAVNSGIAFDLTAENPARALVERFTRREARRGVRRGDAGLLSPLEAESLWLWLADYSYPAIARTVGSTPANALNRVRRALEKISALLAPDEEMAL